MTSRLMYFTTPVGFACGEAGSWKSLLQPHEDKSWYLYVVICKDNSFYTGVTTDLKRRVHEHNHTSRGAKYTRCRRPVSLIYSKVFHDRSSAQSAEFKFKKLTRRQKEEVIAGVV